MTSSVNEQPIEVKEESSETKLLKKMQGRLCDAWYQAVSLAQQDPELHPAMIDSIQKAQVSALRVAQSFAFISAKLGDNSKMDAYLRREILLHMKGFAKEQWADAQANLAFDSATPGVINLYHELERQTASAGAFAAIDLAMDAIDNEMRDCGLSVFESG